jgi:zinc transporter ZupT
MNNTVLLSALWQALAWNGITGFVSVIGAIVGWLSSYKDDPESQSMEVRMSFCTNSKFLLNSYSA